MRLMLKPMLLVLLLFLLVLVMSLLQTIEGLSLVDQRDGKPYGTVIPTQASLMCWKTAVA